MFLDIFPELKNSTQDTPDVSADLQTDFDYLDMFAAVDDTAVDDTAVDDTAVDDTVVDDAVDKAKLEWTAPFGRCRWQKIALAATMRETLAWKRKAGIVSQNAEAMVEVNRALSRASARGGRLIASVTSVGKVLEFLDGLLLSLHKRVQSVETRGS